MPTVALTIKCGATFFNQLFHSAECQYLGATRPPEMSFSGDYQRARYPQEQLLRRHPTTDWPAVIKPSAAMPVGIVETEGPRREFLEFVRRGVGLRGVLELSSRAPIRVRSSALRATAETPIEAPTPTQGTASDPKSSVRITPIPWICCQYGHQSWHRARRTASYDV